MNANETINEVVKVLGAAALLAAYALLSHWSHSDRTITNAESGIYSSSASVAQNESLRRLEI